MADEIKAKVIPMGFPDQFAPAAEKKTEAYGLKVAQAIQYDWWSGSGFSATQYGNRYNEFMRRRLYASGKQPIDKYKDELAYDGDISHLNLDWTPVAFIPKFVDVVVNGLNERQFRIKAVAEDATSQENRSRFQTMIQAQSASKDLMAMTQEALGIDMFATDPDELPEDDEEMAMYMEMKYKPLIEVANETAINAMFAENNFQDTQYRLTKDQVELGVSFAKHNFNRGNGVTLEYVDPLYTIHSYTEDPFFKDCFYWGEWKVVPATELKKINPDLTNDQLREITKFGQSWMQIYSPTWNQQSELYNRDTVALLYFNYKTCQEMVYKKKVNPKTGTVKMIPKDESFNPPPEMMEEGNFERVTKTIDVWYDGVMVLGSNYLLKWELMKNMVRPQSSVQHAMPNYIGCAPLMLRGWADSLVNRQIPFADQCQIAHLKLQQVVQKILPDGIFIDIDGLLDVDLGNGSKYAFKDTLRLFYQTGSVVGRSSTVGGEFNHGKEPFKEISHNNGGNKISALLSYMAYNLQKMMEVAGLTEAATGNPDPNSLVGLQKMAALNSNVATRHILDAAKYIHRELAVCLSMRVADILEFSDFREGFINRIGRYNVTVLEEIKDLYLYDFGIRIEVSPDIEERAALEGNIQMALQQKDISLSDAIDIRQVANLKLANQLLKYRQKKKLEREEKMALQQQSVMAQQQLQAQEVAAQLAMAKIEAEKNAKIEIEGAIGQREMAKLQLEAQLKSNLMAEEFNYQMQIKGVEAETITKRDEMKEDRKDRRTELQATQQSKLVNQRQNNTPPLDFESSGNDVFGGISFGNLGRFGQ